MITFNLQDNEEFITLIRLLKVVGIARSGGEAQQLVVNGMVSLNGVKEYRKRAKLKDGDVVRVDGKEAKICKDKN